MTMHLVAVLMLLISTTTTITHHKCSSKHHDIIKGKNLWQMNMQYKNHPYHQIDNSSSTTNQHRLLLSQNEVQPIRISAYYDTDSISNNNALTLTQKQYLKSVISAVINYYQSFVSIIPIHNTWFFERQCNSWFTQPFGNGKSCFDYITIPYCHVVPVPNEHLAEQLLYSTNPDTATTIPGGVGIANTDLVLYISYYDTNSCGGSTLAHAGTCGYDQYGRPIAGNINICSNFFDGGWKKDVQTILHEMSHITIMLPSLWDGFRDSNGNTLAFSDVYEYDSRYNVPIIKSPKVKTLAKEHFNCYSNVIKGLPLQSNSSSHWHTKWVYTENMNPTIWGSSHYYSKFTLALMEDSGWYIVNYEYAEPY
eukprot:287356_1